MISSKACESPDRIRSTRSWTPRGLMTSRGGASETLTCAFSSVGADVAAKIHDHEVEEVGGARRLRDVDGRSDDGAEQEVAGPDEVPGENRIGTVESIVVDESRISRDRGVHRQPGETKHPEC